MESNHESISQKTILYLLATYFVTSIFGALLSIVLGYALGLPSYMEAGVKPSQSPAYKVTEPFQPLLCLIVYSFFAYRHLRHAAKEDLRGEALRLSTVGVIGSIVIDFVFFVLIPQPYAFTYTEFYVGYQPWITIIYAAIFISPWLATIKLRNVQKPVRIKRKENLMFTNIYPAMLDRMQFLEKRDVQDRSDGTPRLQRLRQITPETGKFIALLAAGAPQGHIIEVGASAGYSTLWLALAAKTTDR